MTELLFEEPFTDPAKVSRDWITAPGMALQNGVLAFAPNFDEGYCVAVTRRNDFRDFSITADVRILRFAVGFVLRAVAPDQYYMVQFDLANNPSVVWFHTFTPSADGGYRQELVQSAHAPRPGDWFRMCVVARGDMFDVLLGEPGSALQHCASWQDREQTFREGAVGLWEHGGESGEYRALRVEALATLPA